MPFVPLPLRLRTRVRDTGRSPSARSIIRLVIESSCALLLSPDESSALSRVARRCISMRLCRSLAHSFSSVACIMRLRRSSYTRSSSSDDSSSLRRSSVAFQLAAAHSSLSSAMLRIWFSMASISAIVYWYVPSIASAVALASDNQSSA